MCLCVHTRAQECGGTERVTQWWNACLAYSRLWVWVPTSTKDKQIPKTKMTDKSNKKQLCGSNIFSSPGYISIRSQNVEDMKLNPSQSHWLPRSYFSLKPCGSVISNYYLEGAGAPAVQSQPAYRKSYLSTDLLVTCTPTAPTSSCFCIFALRLSLLPRMCLLIATMQNYINFSNASPVS